MRRKPSGLTILQLVEIFDAHGFKSLSALEKIPPNPLLWNKKQWNLTVSIIAKALNTSPSQVKKRYRKAGDLLRVFNETLRKTGLVIELQQISKVSEAQIIKQIGEKEWEEEWVNVDT